METLDDRVGKMLAVNKKQKEFYESIEIQSINDKENFIAREWGKFRYKIHNQAAGDIYIWRDLYALHREWMGRLDNKSVLDLGCYIGNPLSIEIAGRAQYYLGIDLSEKAIQSLYQKLLAAGLNPSNVRVEAIDFLSSEFQNRYQNAFDIVYAHSVAHHFEHFEVFLQKLSGLLKPGGIVITFDPLQTSFLIRAVRFLYRPFQSDRRWEWPFTRKTFSTIEKYFIISGIRGTMGKAKWAIPVYLLNKKSGIKLGRRWHEWDKRETTKPGKALWRCLHVSMRWEKPRFP